MFNEVNEIFAVMEVIAVSMHREGNDDYTILEAMCDVLTDYGIKDGTKVFNAMMNQVEEELDTWLAEADAKAEAEAEEEEWLSYYNNTRF